MSKFVTDASGATWWPNWEPMQVAFFLLAEEICQVKEAIPWVRCASGNVYKIKDYSDTWGKRIEITFFQITLGTLGQE